jgi:hypothetical protein
VVKDLWTKTNQVTPGFVGCQFISSAAQTSTPCCLTHIKLARGCRYEAAEPNSSLGSFRATYWASFAPLGSGGKSKVQFTNLTPSSFSNPPL